MIIKISQVLNSPIFIGYSQYHQLTSHRHAGTIFKFLRSGYTVSTYSIYRIMKKTIFISLFLLSLLSLNGCQSIWYLFLKCVVDIAPDRFTVEKDNRKLSIPVHSSHTLTENGDQLEYLMIIVHGAGLNAGNAFERGQQIIESLKIDKSRIMILAPQFLEGVDLDEKGLLFWDQKWRRWRKIFIYRSK